MKTLKEVAELYRRELLPSLRELELERKVIVKRMIISFVVALISAGLALYINTPLQVFIIVYGLGVGLFVYPKDKDFRKQFKQQIIGKIVAFLDSSLVYKSDGYVRKDLYMESGIFLGRHDIYSGTDHVSGTIGKTVLQFSEIKLERKGNKNRNYTVFKGLFIVADFNKNFSGKTFIFPDRMEKYFGNLANSLQKLDSKRGDLVKLEDPEFEKLFKVYSDNQVTARYILSPSLMRRLTEYRKHAGKEVFFSFVNSKIFLAVNNGMGNGFSPRYHGSLVDFEPIKKYYEQLELALGIVDELDLNTRIWTKE